jgi:hypothetical protein
VNQSYFLLSGLVLFGLVRMLLPGRLTLPLVAGLLSMTWVPLDFIRLDTVLTGGYAGNTAALLLAILLLVISWERRSVALLVASCLLGYVTVRVVEVVIPLLLAAPLLLLGRKAARGRALCWWIVAWEVSVLLSIVAFAAPLVQPGARSYQFSALGTDLSPFGVTTRLAGQFGFHLLPLFAPFGEMWTSGVAVTVAIVAALMLGLTGPELSTPAFAGDRRSQAIAAAGGLLWAALAYAPFALTPSVKGAGRTQILAAPGIGLFLAAVVCWAAGRLPARLRRTAATLVACWVVAVGTGRTLALQRDWDAASYWPEQSGTLTRLLQTAPDFAPNTFLLLIDEGKAWPATFTFRHAVEYVYGGHVVAAVWGVPNYLYDSVFTPEGVACIPWEVIRKPWDVRVTRHRYEEVVIARRDAQGQVSLLEDWPPGLPPLPEGTVYAPRKRVLSHAGSVGHREILGQGSRP